MAGEFSHNENKYFFLHIPKTGGKMWEHLFSGIGLTSGHAFVESKPEGYSFTVIRNPFDRLVSCFYYLKAGGCWSGDANDALKYDITHNSFEDWLKLAAQNPEHYLEQQHVMPMMRRIGKKENFDHIGLFENLEQETKNLYSIIHGEDLEEVPVINKSSHKDFRDCYTEETASIVAELYREDINLYKELLNA
ncbi:sulfotransferase family protein [Porticoccaceae bacterium]|nr:sulfotransferase family protein [Porticoccaceae bacterium]MDC1325037.1 sulfotransferase family protein [Ulvibacter sp.]|tara:strand:+ start:1262 stop:1837 length:576 start_codon:yes stop_codon:yes gene_type:complete